jgi:hypothetical protein
MNMRQRLPNQRGSVTLPVMAERRDVRSTPASRASFLIRASRRPRSSLRSTLRIGLVRRVQLFLVPLLEVFGIVHSGALRSRP